MASRLAEFQAVLEAAFVAATPAFAVPPDVDPNGGLAYRWIDTLTEERGNGQHRELTWGKPTLPKVLTRHFPVLEWQITASLFLDRRGRTAASFTRVLADAIEELHRAYRRQASIGWGGGITAHLDPPRSPGSATTPQARAGGVRETSVVARIDFPFRVAIRERS